MSCRETDQRKSAVFNNDIDFEFSNINTVSVEYVWGPLKTQVFRCARMQDVCVPEIYDEMQTIDIDTIKDILERNCRKMDFSLLFGSYAEGKSSVLSDVDIGIHFSEKPELLEQGRMIEGLEEGIGVRVDLVVLNDLYHEKPELAYNIVTQSKELIVNDRKRLVDFKTRVFLHYFDVKPMLEENRKYFGARIRSGKIGERNYHD